ncbi:Uu.00g071300.m01.CDS01 [Anthostomella pinea]|uniref:Uu.00g071300.m01.CDS01 n=1 Tax=Anthostomella pinea TaxID=933095 RepID=A0AAI8VVQ9_9PEZI|nr:Uu.00g071300.m01.CDS01 [Anthostomella pinea]
MMLTPKQPVHYGYRPVHDLPTPPRSSPPVTVQDSSQKPLPALPLKQSPSVKPMSAPHRGLPLPAVMTLPQPPPSGHPHPPAPGPPLQGQGPPAPSPHGQSLGALPAPPQWQGSEESMRNWLMAKTEEEKRRQEEEKTRQETLRLEQRRIEHDILRTSLDRGIPPPMVPVVFAGMSGATLPQAALDWIQQQYLPPQQAHPAQLLPAQGAISPEQRRDSQQYGPYAGSVGVPSTPGSGAGTQVGFVPYQGPGSPTRQRAHTLSMGGPVGRPLGGTALPRIRTGEGVTEPSSALHPSHGLAQQAAASQQETQSPSIYFHYWQPPNSQAGSNQPSAPSVDSPRKRKATGPPQSGPPPTSQTRLRSPPFVQQGGPSMLSNPPPGRRRGHSRQRSDISSYRSSGRGRGEGFGPHGGFSPGLGTSREAPTGESSQQQPRSSGHSVSSMLSDQPSPRYVAEMRAQQGESERRNSPNASEERSRGGPPRENE